MASKNAIEAGEAFVKVSADDSMLNRTLNRIVERFRKTGELLQSIGKGAAIAGAGLLAPLVGTFTAAIRHADAIQDVADRMNTTTEAVSRLGYAADFSASSIEDIEAGNKFLTKSALAAADGAKEQADAFKKLGISAEEFLQLDVDERFLRIAGALEELDSPLERSKFLTATLGKNYTTLVPLLDQGTEGLKKLFDEAERSGSVLNSEDARRSAETMDMIDKAWKEVKNTIFEVGRTFLDFTGELQSGSDSLSQLLRNIRQWVRENRAVIVSIAAIGVGLVATGVALITLGTAMKVAALATGALSAAFGVLGTVAATTWAIVTSPITLVVAGIAAITVAIAAVSTKLQKVGTDIASTFRGVASTLGQVFGGIVAALKKGDINKAWEIVSLGMQAVWLDLIILLRSKWYDFTNFFADAFRNAVVGIQTIFLGLVKSIQTGFLDSLLFILNKINDAQKAAKELFGKETLDKDLPQAAQEKIKANDAEATRLAFVRNRELEKAYKLRARIDAGEKGLNEPLKDVLDNASKILDQMDKLARLNQNIRASGGQLIDTSSLEEAKKNIEVEHGQRIDSIKKEADERKNVRDQAQQQRLNDIEFERDATKAMLKDIIDDLNKIEPEGPNVAPMPRVKRIMELESQLGDSVKGLFNSADFQGTLGLGAANVQSQQLDKLGEISAKLTNIENKIEPGVFS